jgi:ribosome-binding ATPase YchF (GTP1/OBG family)
MLKGLGLLTAKRALYVANVSETDLKGASPGVRQIEAYAKEHGGAVIPVSAEIEEELVQLDEPDRHDMLESMGLEAPALDKVARAAYALLGLQSFFTTISKKLRAWTVPEGTTAPEAAGVIHTDFERGFIRVEVYSVDDLAAFGSEARIKAAGKMRIEGKSYAIQDGDVCHFLFNV